MGDQAFAKTKTLIEKSHFATCFMQLKVLHKTSCKMGFFYEWKWTSNFTSWKMEIMTLSIRWDTLNEGLSTQLQNMVLMLKDFWKK
jgi:hypothetical protein